MDFFMSLWNDPEQVKVPSAENFGQDITSEKWLNQSATFKLISGSYRHPQEWLGLDKYFKDHSSKPEVLPLQQTRKEKNLKTSNNTKTPNTENGDGSQVGDSGGETDSNSDNESVAESSFHQSHQYVPGLRKNPVNDKMSGMDTNDHADCLSLYLKFSKYPGSTIMPADRSDHFRFEVMYKMVQDEQKELTLDAQKLWPEAAKSMQSLSMTFMHTLQVMWMKKSKKALEFYPHVYKRRLMVPLTTTEMKIEMLKVADLLQIGKIPLFFQAKLLKRTVAQTHTHKILSSSQYHLTDSQTVGSLHKLPVSLDPNAESLARLHKAQIVISSGALNTLLETYFNFSKSWTLPISVKEYRTIEKGKTTSKTIVFIDKPLPKQTMPATDCYRFLFKYGIKSRMLEPKHTLCFGFPIPGVDPLEKESFPDPSGSDKSTTFAVSAEKLVSEEPNENSLNKVDIGKKSDVDDDDDDDDRLVIEEDLNQNEDAKKTSIKKESSVTATANPSIRASNTNSTVGNKYEPYKRKDGLRLPKTPDGYTAPISTTNVTYSSWVIRPENDDKLKAHQKKVLKELPVIVRCRVDGCQRIDGDVVAVSLSSKPEYQLEFSAEEPTKEELVREWSSLFFKPASLVVRTRVDVKGGEIIMYEKKDKFQISADAQRLHGIRLSDSLRTLYSVFSEVSSLTKGSYLLHHSPEENAFASLEESIEATQDTSKSVRNLNESFGPNFSVQIDPKPEWRKLDCTLVLPRHEVLHVMPATYRPKPGTSKFKARTIPTKVKDNSKFNNSPGIPPKKKKKKNSKNRKRKQEKQESQG